MRILQSRRAFLAVALSAPLALSACGFRLRGHFQAPFDALYLQMRGNTRFSGLMKRMIESGSNIKCVPDAHRADAVLELINMKRERDILTISDSGRAREYELTLTIDFRVTSPDGFIFVDSTTLVAHRDITYSESEFLARENEEEVLYQDMENDLLSQLLRYLEAARRPD